MSDMRNLGRQIKAASIRLPGFGASSAPKPRMPMTLKMPDRGMKGATPTGATAATAARMAPKPVAQQGTPMSQHVRELMRTIGRSSRFGVPGGVALNWILQQAAAGNEAQANAQSAVMGR